MDAILLIIKKLRKFRGITQEAMAEQLHLSVRAYQKIEGGHTRIDTYRLEKIATILGISMSDLVNAKSKSERWMPVLQETSHNKAATVVYNTSFIIKRVLNVLIESREREVLYLQEVSAQEF
jgi:transcriptional regulator with XRE-family HTH domain